MPIIQLNSTSPIDFDEHVSELPFVIPAAYMAYISLRASDWLYHRTYVSCRPWKFSRVSIGIGFLCVSGIVSIRRGPLQKKLANF